jgi:hypothetical protein
MRNSHLKLPTALACLFMAGCLPSGDPALSHDDPAVKIPAIKRAAVEGRHESLGHLIRDLDSDDPAVRVYAIAALERIAGERFEYQPYHDEEQRKPAIQRWREWLSRRQADAQDNVKGG